jgi:hypothetical protein
MEKHQCTDSARSAGSSFGRDDGDQTSANTKPSQPESLLIVRQACNADSFYSQLLFTRELVKGWNYASHKTTQDCLFDVFADSQHFLPEQGRSLSKPLFPSLTTPNRSAAPEPKNSPEHCHLTPSGVADYHSSHCSFRHTLDPEASL